MGMKLKVKIGDRWYLVEIVDLNTNPAKVLVDGDPVEVDLDVEANSVTAEQNEGDSDLSVNAVSDTVEDLASVNGSNSDGRVFSSPMPGVIVSVAVKVGDLVVTGDEICVLEAMKMQQTLRADWTGKVRAVHVQAGKQVLDGDPIAELM